MKQLPRQLKRDEGLARAGRQREQDALLAGDDGFQHALDGDVLIVAALEVAAPVFKRDRGEAVAPSVLLGEGQVPEFIGSRVAGHVPFGPLVHVDAVEALSVGGVREADRQLPGVVLRLRHAFGQSVIPRLRFDDRQLGVAILQHVVGGE